MLGIARPLKSQKTVSAINSDIVLLRFSERESKGMRINTKYLQNLLDKKLDKKKFCGVQMILFRSKYVSIKCRMRTVQNT